MVNNICAVSGYGKESYLAVDYLFTGITEGTIQNEDTLAQTTSRVTTSLPQPLARSTHVVINETVEEEVEIDETSPTEVVSRISEEPASTQGTSGQSQPRSSDADKLALQEPQSDSSSGVSPVKKAKTTKTKKKKLSLSKQSSVSEKSAKAEENSKAKSQQSTQESNDKGGIKRSRSQRSLVDVERAQKAKAEAAKAKKDSSPDESLSSPPFHDLDSSNVTVRRSTRGPQSGSGSESNGSDKKGKKGKPKKKVEEVETSQRVTRSSVGSNRSSGGSKNSMFDDSAEETQLHTIVYDKEIEQSLLNDSSELTDSKQTSKGNVTIPETPDASDESDLEPEPVITKKKNGRTAK